MLGKQEQVGKQDPLDRLVEIFERSPIALTLADASAPDLPLVIANRAFLDLTGYARDEVLGRNCRFLQGDLDNVLARGEVRDCIALKGSCQVVFRNRRKGGEAFENLVFVQALIQRNGEAAYFLGSQFLLDTSVSELRIDRHLAEIDAAVGQAVAKLEHLRAQQRRMLADAAHAVANAWLSLR